MKGIKICLRYWVTVMSYAVYGLGSLLLWYGVYPLTSRFVDRSQRPAHARYLSYRAFGVFVRFLKVAGYWRYRIYGQLPVEPAGILIIANHPSFLDIVMLFSLVKNAVCVVKPSLAKVPLVGVPIRRCRHILAGTPEQVVAESVAALRNGANLILFPQGTRTPPELPLKFQRSAARIALEAEAPVIPVHFRYRPLLLGKGQGWYNVPAVIPRVSVVVGDRLLAEECKTPDLPLSIASRRLNRAMEGSVSDLETRHGSSGTRA